jgi:hypothetical protein
MIDALLALSLSAVLDRAATYVAQFEQQLSGFVAEEQYQQDWPQLPQHHSIPDADRHRTLVSDVLLVKVGSDWVQLRDVREMDGKSIAYRGESMLDMVRRGEVTRPVDVDALIDRSAAYNLGEVTRTVNTPLFALTFLEAANQKRCRFKMVPNRIPATLSAQPDIPGAFKTSTEIWVVEYEEREKPTLIRSKRVGGEDVPAHGRFWIEAETGRVFMSEVIAQSRTVKGTIDVSYQSEPVKGLLLPIEMREWYEGRKTGSKIETIATYGRFRELER